MLRHCDDRKEREKESEREYSMELVRIACPPWACVISPTEAKGEGQRRLLTMRIISTLSPFAFLAHCTGRGFYGCTFENQNTCLVKSFGKSHIPGRGLCTGTGTGRHRAESERERGRASEFHKFYFNWVCP